MTTLWIFGGLICMVAGMGLYLQRHFRRRHRSKSRSVMTKTMDGESLQFLVRPTRKGSKE